MRSMLDGRLAYSRRLKLAGGAVVCAIMATGIAMSAPAAAGTEAPLQRISDEAVPAGPGGFADLAEKVQPAVIGVVTKMAASPRALGGQALVPPDDEDAPDQEIPMPRPGGPDHGEGPQAKPHEAVTIGSGFFISADGYAVTNRHVVENSDTAEIRTSDDKTYTARIVGRDALSDI